MNWDELVETAYDLHDDLIDSDDYLDEIVARCCLIMIEMDITS